MLFLTYITLKCNRRFFGLVDDFWRKWSHQRQYFNCYDNCIYGVFLKHTQHNGHTSQNLSKQIFSISFPIFLTSVFFLIYQYLPSKVHQTQITLGSILDKIQVMANLWKYSVTFKIQEAEQPKPAESERLYMKYCKQTLGISKYSCNILILSELGRYPLQTT